MRRAVLIVAMALLVAPHPALAADPPLSKLVGQRLMVAMQGTWPSVALLERIREGRVGGVILFSSNISSRSQLTALTARLQMAARAGGNPPLLIAADQEGGRVRRLPWAPPVRSARELGLLKPSGVREVGVASGRALDAAGVNLNLAPVADVPRYPRSFIWTSWRAFAFDDRYRVGYRAAAFAGGLRHGGTLAALKHFPGLGRALVTTDRAVVTISAGRSLLIRDLLPYSLAFRQTRPLVMLSTARYPALDWRAAAWSPVIIRSLLRGQLGFPGVTITDSLDGAARARGLTDLDLAPRCLLAGADIVLITGSEATSAAVYARLLALARQGVLPGWQLRASYGRIAAVKGSLP